MTATPNGEPKAPEDNPFTQEITPVVSTETPTTDPVPDPEPSTLEKPKANASKPEWIAYADAQGVDSSGTVKDIQARFDAEPTSEFESEILAELQGEHLPISSVAGDLLGEVKVNAAGLRVLNVTMNGFIGVEPVSVLVESAGDIEKLLSQLRTIAGEKLAQ